MKLTEKQKRFADYYIETGNATEAYKRAGYKAKNYETIRANASRLLTNANVKAYIDTNLKQKDNERIASQNEVLEFLTKVMRGEVVEEIPVVMKDNWEMVNKTPNVKDRVKAAELLGKRYTLFTEKVNVEGNLGVQIVDDIEDDANDDEG
ncbi:terminase small subunit [Tepidibacillus fermentans]|uniref:Phage terminase small subunit n=1 Tax=Tepidibacillus fermentans TaxID=1281767 RepID=A0A4R3KBD3_9BACI|nr:terminase small subunit [Tepidibacillus fermentans]TCS80367.1 phage terminase small subunit [Tepidibacillus fermentans]